MPSCFHCLCKWYAKTVHALQYAGHKGSLSHGYWLYNATGACLLASIALLLLLPWRDIISFFHLVFSFCAAPPRLLPRFSVQCMTSHFFSRGNPHIVCTIFVLTLKPRVFNPGVPRKAYSIRAVWGREHTLAPWQNCSTLLQDDRDLPIIDHKRSLSLHQHRFTFLLVMEIWLWLYGGHTHTKTETNEGRSGHSRVPAL